MSFAYAGEFTITGIYPPSFCEKFDELRIFQCVMKGNFEGGDYEGEDNCGKQVYMNPGNRKVAYFCKKCMLDEKFPKLIKPWCTKFNISLDEATSKFV